MSFHPTIIQIVLSIGILAMLFTYFFYFKSKVINRLLFLAIFGVGFLFVLFPSISNRVAHLMGVGRGADLILYLFVLCFLVAFVALYARIRGLEQTIVQLIRQNAINAAEKSGEPGQSNT